MSKKHARDLARIDEVLAPHTCKPRNARAFDFRTPGKGSAYAFSLTWTPGSLSLAGDCGELTICHYNALWSLEEGLRWAAGADLHYLLEKTRLKKRFDREATVLDLVKMANVDAIDARKALRDEMRRWRAQRPDPYGWYDPTFDCDYVDWLQARPADEPAWTAHVRPREKYEFTDTEERVVVPYGWELWNEIRKAMGCPNVDAIHTGGGRRHLADLVDQFIQDEHAAYELCYAKLGIDDYRAEYTWGFHDILQAECVRRGAKMALEQLDAEPPFVPYAWRPALADEMAAAFPRTFSERYGAVLARAA